MVAASYLGKQQTIMYTQFKDYPMLDFPKNYETEFMDIGHDSANLFRDKTCLEISILCCKFRLNSCLK